MVIGYVCVSKWVFSGGSRVFWMLSRRFGVVFGRFGVFPRTPFNLLELTPLTLPLEH